MNKGQLQLMNGKFQVRLYELGATCDTLNADCNMLIIRMAKVMENNQKANGDYQRIFDEKVERCEYIATLEKCNEKQSKYIRKLEEKAYPKMEITQEVDYECRKHEWFYDKNIKETICKKCLVHFPVSKQIPIDLSKLASLKYLPDQIQEED